MTTPGLSKQDGISARLHLRVVSEEVDLLVDGGCPWMLGGGSWIFLLIKLSADGRDTGCGGTSVVAADSLAATSAAAAILGFLVIFNQLNVN